MERTINTRILQRSGTTSEWKGKIPKRNELIVYTDGIHHPRLKVGDGTTATEGLKFIDVDAIHDGEGTGAIVINSGQATGKYAVAGGLTDKTVISSIVGSSFGESVTPAKAEGDMSICFGANSTAQSVGSAAIGVDCIAGCKGLYMWSIDTSTNTVTLSTNRPSLTTWSRTKPSSVPWSVGDVVHMIDDNGSGDATILSIDATNMTIKVDNLPMTELTFLTTLPHDRSIYCPAKPLAGSVVLTHFSWAQGYNNKSLGLLSFTHGYGNTATGTCSFVTGRENYGGFASLVGGYQNTASIAGFAAGRSNTVNGDASGAVGALNTVTGERAFATGANNIVTADYAFAGGLTSEATGKYSFSFGHMTKATAGSQAVVGRYNVTDNNFAFIVGNGKSSSAPENALTVSWQGDTVVNRHLTVGSNATVSGDLTVKGSTLLTEDVEIQGQLQLHGNAKIDDADILTSADTDTVVTTAVQTCNKNLASATGIDYTTNYVANKTYNKLPCITTLHTGEAGMNGPVPPTYHISRHKRYNLIPHYRCENPSDEIFTYSVNGGTFESTPDGRIHVSGTFNSTSSSGTYYILSTSTHSNYPRRMILPPGTYAFHNCYAQYRVLAHDSELNLYSLPAKTSEVRSMSGMKLQTFDTPVILERLSLHFANGTTVDDYFVPFICVADGRQNDIEILEDGIYIKGQKVSAAEFYCPRITSVDVGSGEEQEITLPSSNYLVESDINPVCRVCVYGNYADVTEYIDLGCFMPYASALITESVTFKKLLENEHSKKIYSGSTLPEESMGSLNDIYIMYE